MNKSTACLFFVAFLLSMLLMPLSASAGGYRHPDVSIYNHWDDVYTIDKYNDMLVLYCGYSGIKFYRHENDELELYSPLIHMVRFGVVK